MKVFFVRLEGPKSGLRVIHIYSFLAFFCIKSNRFACALLSQVKISSAFNSFSRLIINSLIINADRKCAQKRLKLVIKAFNESWVWRVGSWSLRRDWLFFLSAISNYNYQSFVRLHYSIIAAMIQLKIAFLCKWCKRRLIFVRMGPHAECLALVRSMFAWYIQKLFIIAHDVFLFAAHWATNK